MSMCECVRLRHVVCLAVSHSLSARISQCASLPRSVCVPLYLGLYTWHAVLQCLHLCITSKDRKEHQHNKDNEEGIRHRLYRSWKRDRAALVRFGDYLGDLQRPKSRSIRKARKSLKITTGTGLSVARTGVTSSITTTVRRR